MDDIARLGMVARIRAAKLASLERALANVVSQAAEAAQLAQQAAAAAHALTSAETGRIQSERDTLLSGPFRIDALSDFKTARRQALQNITEANALAKQAKEQYSAVELIRQEMARKLLIERSRNDCIGRNLTMLKRTRANRAEARTAEEFGERQR